MKTNNEYEIRWWRQGKQAIVGLDEAGRGPIAGPLVVAGVCFPSDFEDDEIYDSKALSEKKRKMLFHKIITLASEYQIKIVDIAKIDTYNIYRATQNAMEEIVNDFIKCDGVLSDAMPLPNVNKDVIAIVKGDQQSVSIAAASILAKVVRDGIMKGYDVLYPAYGFAKHKGYPTKAHIEALDCYGIIEKLHRKSYGPVAKRLVLQKDEN